MSCTHVVVLACGTLLLTSCAGEDKLDPWRTGLDVTTSTARVSEQARDEVCRSLGTHLDEALDFYKLTRLMCAPAGLLRSGSSVVCEQLVANCMQINAPEPLLFGARIDQQRCKNQLVHCESPVGALEACINQNVAHVQSLLDQLTCERIGDRAARESAARTLDVSNAVTRCADLSPACQNMIEDAIVR